MVATKVYDPRNRGNIKPMEEVRAQNAKAQAAEFLGPLFIVGMPRSGTKLIRGLLNGHSRINVSMHETEFLPFWIKNWDRYGDLSSDKGFASFYGKTNSIPYFRSIKVDAKTFQSEWFAQCSSFTAAGVFDALMRVRTGASEESSVIWADKSPSYINHLDLIKQNFPNARFLHIVRDARDQANSCHKAWRKQHVRTAQRWVDGNSRAKQSDVATTTDYMLIHYEEVIGHTENVLLKCCEFLSLPYEEGMLTKATLIEGRGDAKGYQGVKADNANKFREEMNPKLLLQIERVAGDLLRQYGYEVGYAGPQRRVPPLQMSYLRALDGLNLVKSRADNQSVIGAIKMQMQHLRSSGNNNL